MRFCFLISIMSPLIALLPFSALADVRLYTGNLEVVTTSGKACAGRKGNHTVSIVIGSDDVHESIFGFIGGDTVTVGQIRGISPDSLNLRYPYPDTERAEGHIMKVEVNGLVLTGELRDRHIEASVDDCNFDLARFKLHQADGNDAALASYQRLSKRYDAQLARSTALSIARSGDNAGAVHVFERALALADELYAPDSAQIFLYLTGLGNSYIRAGRYQDFISLYNLRKESLIDPSVRQIFDHHQIRSLLHTGRAALAREEHDAALENFRQALQIDYKNKDAISATMSALVHTGRHDEAIAFLEETELKLDNEPDRVDVREATALVVYQKARKEHKEGRKADAERYLRKAIKLDPGTAHYLVVLARWVHKGGKYSEADAILKRGLESFKDEPRRQELNEARDKLRNTEMILARIRKAGG